MLFSLSQIDYDMFEEEARIVALVDDIDPNSPEFCSSSSDDSDSDSDSCYSQESFEEDTVEFVSRVLSLGLLLPSSLADSFAPPPSPDPRRDCFLLAKGKSRANGERPNSIHRKFFLSSGTHLLVLLDRRPQRSRFPFRRLRGRGRRVDSFSHRSLPLPHPLHLLRHEAIEPILYKSDHTLEIPKDFTFDHTLHPFEAAVSLVFSSILFSPS